MKETRRSLCQSRSPTRTSLLSVLLFLFHRIPTKGHNTPFIRPDLLPIHSLPRSLSCTFASLSPPSLSLWIPLCFLSLFSPTPSALLPLSHFSGKFFALFLETLSFSFCISGNTHTHRGRHTFSCTQLLFPSPYSHSLSFTALLFREMN